MASSPCSSAATGLDIHSPDPAAAIVAAALAEKHRAGIGPLILLRWLVTSTVLVVVAVLTSIPLSLLNSGDLTIGPQAFALASYTAQPDGGYSMSLDFNVILVVSLVGAVLSVVARPPKKRDGKPAANGSPHPVLM